MMKITFQDIEKRLPSPVRRWLKHVNRWLDKAWWLWGVVTKAVTCFVEKEQRVVRSHIEYHRLGKQVYRRLCAQPDADHISVTEPMRDIERNISRTDREIEERMRYLDHVTVTHRPD